MVLESFQSSGILGSIVVLVLRAVPSMKNYAKAIEYAIALVPTFCFDFSFNLLLNNISIYVVDYPNEWIFFNGDEMIKEFNLLLSMIIYSSVECVLYTIIFIIIESRSYSFKKPTNEKLYSDIKDNQVLQEIERANSVSDKILSLRDNTTNDININIIKNKNYDNEIFSVRIIGIEY